MNNFKFFKAASEAYLCAPLPANWESLSYEDQSDFLTSNVWEPLGDKNADELWNLIDSMAWTIETVCKRGS